MWLTIKETQLVFRMKLKGAIGSTECGQGEKY